MKKALLTGIIPAVIALSACMPTKEGVQDITYAPGARASTGDVTQELPYDTAYWFPFRDSNGVVDRTYIRALIAWDNNGNPWWCYSGKVLSPIPVSNTNMPNVTLVAEPGYNYVCGHTPDVFGADVDVSAAGGEVVTVVLGKYMAL